MAKRKQRTADDIFRGDLRVVKPTVPDAHSPVAQVGNTATAGVPRDDNGAILPNDIHAARVRDETGRMLTVRKPVEIDSEFQERIKDLTVQQAFAAMRQRDVETGDAYRVYETYKGKALGGDREIAKDYMDRMFGKAVQTITVAQHVKVTLDPEARQIIEGIREAFGMKPRELIDTTAKEVA